MFSEKKTVEECGRQMDGIACLYYKLTCEPKGSDELIKMYKKVSTIVDNYMIQWVRVVSCTKFKGCNKHCSQQNFDENCYLILY